MKTIFITKFVFTSIYLDTRLKYIISLITSVLADDCRYPDNIQVSITQNGLTCSSGVFTYLANNNNILLVVLVIVAWLPVFSS